MSSRSRPGKPRAGRLVAASLLVGCGAPSHDDRATTNVIEPARRDPADEATRLLSRDVLHHDRFARRVVYSWTTKDQIDELRASSRLLSRDESPEHGASYLDQVLYLLARRGDPVAKLLYTTAFAKMRFAWHAPWATRNGWPNEQYGDQLIRVTLRPAAVIVSVSTATGTFEAKNLMNEPVPLAAVLARPESIGAIYFVSDASQPTAAGLPRPTASFRELALCNEAMIEAWEVGTDRIAADLAASAATVDAMARYLERQPDARAESPPLAWRSTAPRQRRPDRAASPEAAYAASLALDSPLYRLDAVALAALADRLRATPMPAAFEGTTTLAFRPGTVRKPPRVVKRLTTYATYSLPASPTAAKP